MAKTCNVRCCKSEMIRDSEFGKPGQKGVRRLDGEVVRVEGPGGMSNFVSRLCDAFHEEPSTGSETELQELTVM